MRATSITTALVIAGLTVLWLASGLLSGEERVEDHPPLSAAETGARANAAPTAVRARIVHAVPLPERVQVRGRTENKRTVDVRAETTGRVVARPIDRGDRVKEGDLLCRLALEDRPARRAEAEAAVEQARLEHEGSLRLQDQGLQSETAIAQAKARLTAAEAMLAGAVLDIERTRVFAPFDGVVEDVNLNVGDYAQPGAPCARVVDLDPMLLVGRVSETEAHRFDVGAVASGRLATGVEVSGPVSFVGRQADPGTRTYRVEVTLPNPDYALRSGLTAEFVVRFGETLAHRISPALLALDDEGRLGVRIVRDGDRVAFVHVEILADEEDGVWVSGLPTRTTLITVGHQFVTAGDRVNVQLERARQAPGERRRPDAPTGEGVGETVDDAHAEQPLAATAGAAAAPRPIAEGT